MTASPVQHPLRVSALMVASGLMMTMMVVFARLAATHGHAIVEVTFFRNFVGALFLLGLILKSPGSLAMLKTERPLGHLFRGAVGIAGLALNFYAVTLLPLAEQTSLFFAMPLFVTVMAIVFLKERVDWRRWLTLILGFAGILLIAQPSGGGNPFGVAIALAGAFGAGVSVIMVRHLGSSEPEMRTVFYFFTFGALVSALFLPWYWTAPTLESFVYLVATGLAGMLGQLLLTRAYAEAPAGFLAPFTYLSILYSTLFGWMLWDEWPDRMVFVGVAVVVAAGLANVALEKTRTVKAETEVEVGYG